MAREETPLQQQHQLQRRLAAGRSVARRTVRIRSRLFYQGTTGWPGRPAERPDACCRLPARRIFTTSTTSSLLNTPQFSKFRRQRCSSSVGPRRKLLRVVVSRHRVRDLRADWRPTQQLRISPQYQLQSYDRRTDGSTVGVGRIPRLKVEYQVSRPVFLRFIGEYTSQNQDALRDDSRTNLPIVIRDPATGLFQPSPAFERNRFESTRSFPTSRRRARCSSRVTAVCSPNRGRCASTGCSARAMASTSRRAISSGCDALGVTLHVPSDRTEQRSNDLVMADSPDRRADAGRYPRRRPRHVAWEMDPAPDRSAG